MPERVELLLEPIGGRGWDGVPTGDRLRGALKALARFHGLRAVTVKQTGKPDPPPPRLRWEEPDDAA